MPFSCNDSVRNLDDEDKKTYLRIIQNPLGATSHLYALVDTRHHTLNDWFARWNICQYRSLWDTLVSNECSDIAPYLLHVAAPSQLSQQTEFQAASSTSALIAQLLKTCKDKPMLTWLWSSQPFNEIYLRLQAWIECHTPDGMPVLMHFYDNRILPAWLSALSPEQRQAFIGIAEEWWYADREGRLKIAVKENEPAPLELPIRLTNTQEHELLNANTADSIISDIASVAPELTADRHYPTFHREVETLLKNARAYKIDSYSEQMQFAMLGLIYGTEFDRHERLQIHWEQLKTGDAKFADIVTEAHDIWQ